MSSAVHTASLMTRLNHDWEHTQAPREHLFGALGIRGCGDLLEEIRQLHRLASGRQGSAEAREKAAAQEDATLYELITLARGGDRQAERVLVQLLLPAAQRMAHRVTRLGDFDRADRVGYAIGAAWESIRGFKLHLRRRIHANLTMGMLSILAPEKTQNEKLIHDCTVPVSDEVLVEEAGEWEQPETPVEIQLARLFTWAVDTGVLQRDEVALLSRSALGDETAAEIAASLGLTRACLRKRVDRIRARLSAAAREQF